MRLVCGKRDAASFGAVAHHCAIVRTVPHRGPGGTGQCVYWDEALESFGLHPSGRRVCAYRVNQRKRLATLGRADALSLDQARKKAMTYLAKAANQEDPQSDIEAHRELKTIDQLCEAYIELGQLR